MKHPALIIELPGSHYVGESTNREDELMRVQQDALPAVEAFLEAHPLSLQRQ